MTPEGPAESSHRDRKPTPLEQRATTRSAVSGRVATLQEPLASNPFRILRLPASASGSQIRQTIDQARIEARLSSNPDRESRVDALTRAQSELLDPSKRIQREVLWFYDPPDCLYDGRLEETEQALARFRTDGDPEKHWESAHDWALWLMVEAVHSSDPESAERWTVRGLSAWREISRDPFYLRHISGRDKSPRSATVMIWEMGVGVLAVCARRCMNAGDVDGVLSRYRGAKSYGVEEADLLKIVQPAIEIGVLEAQRIVTEARAGSEGIPSEPIEASSWARRLERSLSGQVDLQEEVADLGARELEKVLDEAADVIRGVAVSLYSDLTEAQVASELIDVALSLAVSRNAVEQLESDLGTLRGSIAVGPLAEVLKEAVASLQSEDDAEGLFACGETVYESLADYQNEDNESAIAALNAVLPVLRAVAIRLHNEYGKTSDAVTVMAWCVELADDDEARERFETDKRQLLYQMHMANCLSLIGAKRWPEAEGVARAALLSADSAEDRKIANDAVAAIANKRNARGLKPIWIAVAVAVVGLIIWGAIAGSDDGSSSIPSSGNASGGSITKCRGMLDNLNDVEETLNSIESQINTIEGRYPGGVAPSAVVARYDGLVNRYNAQRSTYNNLVRAYNGECAR